MRNRTLSASIALFAMIPAVVAWTAMADGKLELAPQSRLWVDGTSSVRDWTCTAGIIEADVTTTSEAAITDVASGTKAISAVEVRIPATRLDCKNKQMNEHMFKALKATAHPGIAYRVDSYTLAKAGSGVEATLVGALTLGGVEKPITVVASAKEEGGMLRVRGTREITMTEFGLKPPTLMMGTLKVGPDVTVGFDFILTP
jgi:polyisoprenoid-binding protein YceI